MAIRVAPGAADLPADLAGRFLVLVRGAADPGAALAGLHAARDDLAALGPAMLSGVVMSPDGPLLRVGSLEADDDVLQTVPDLVVAALERHGVRDGTLDLVEPGGEVDRLDHTPNAAVLRLFPHPAGPDGRLPLGWLEVAADWVLGDATAEETVALRLLGASYRVAAGDAASTLHGALAARTWCDLVHGDLGHRIRTASLTFGRAPHLALAAGGPGCNAAAVLARFELLREVAREVGDVAYACVDLEETFGDVGTGVPGTGWPAHGGADPNAVAGLVVDVAVPDAFPVQLLGPGHLARHTMEGAPLGDGRIEVVLGDPTDWLPTFEAREEVVDLAIKDLGDLLVTDAQVVELARHRPARGTQGAAGAVASGPDLDHVTLEAVSRPRRGLHLTLLELAAWLAHEPHTDAPRSVSPVLSAYARWLASGLDHDGRQVLKPYAARLVGTRVPGIAPAPWRPLAPADAARADLAVDWLAREQVAAWLRVAGHDRAAAALMKVRRLADGSHRSRQLRLLDDAVVALLSDVAVGAGDEEAWDAWERAGEASAWVAASEAAWIGVPDTIASATELRARETVQDLLVPASTASAEIRAVAVAAAADEGWRLAGAAAAAAVDAEVADADLLTPEALTAVPLATAWERALHGARNRTGLDQDAVEVAIEAAETSARAVLGDLIDGGEPPEHSLQVALHAAEASAGGTVWRVARDLARGVVGGSAWERGDAAADEAMDRVIHAAPPLVDRAVLVTLAREVAGLAARTAVARHGAQVLEPVVAELRPSALALLDALIETR